ncbi:MAG: enoyl-CoA hydratase/isomerase family protein [Thermodesulfobacteriota bacterium]|nr:enoyl-CoA hydratase/isomerase family protein [Thermodesulfobacteriota bacterium]
MLETRIEDQILIANITNGKTNSITKESLDKLKQAIEKVKKDEAVKGLVLTGNGRFFSSGFDLYTFMGFEKLEQAVSFLKYADEVLLGLFLCPKPVVAAMNGHTAAGGLILAMASDYRIVTDHPKIKIGMSEIKIGVPLSVAQSAVMRFGLDSDKKFRDVMYFGEMVDVTKALKMEIVDETVNAEELIDKAKAIVSLWIDTPARPFCRIKEELKYSTGENIRKRLKQDDWHDALNCFFKKEVKDTLAFVQSTME